MAFVLQALIVIHCLLISVITCSNAIYSLKKHEAVFFMRQNLI